MGTPQGITTNRISRRPFNSNKKAKDLSARFVPSHRVTSSSQSRCILCEARMIPTEPRKACSSGVLPKMQPEQEPQANRSTGIQSGFGDIPKAKLWRDEETSSFSLSNNASQMMDHGSFVAQSWLSDPSWDAMVANGPWSDTPTSTHYHHPVIGHEDILYSSFDSQYQGNDAPHFNSNRGHYPAIKTNSDPTITLVNRRHERFNPQDEITYGIFSFLPQSVPYSQYHSYEEIDRDNQTSSSVAQLSPYQLVFPENQFLVPKQEPQAQTPEGSISVPSSEQPTEPFVFVNTFSDSSFSAAPASTTKLSLNWSPTTAEEHPLTRDLSILYPDLTHKRKLESSPPPISGVPAQPSQNMSDFVVVFENAPGALASVKKRKKLEAPVRKAAKDVRRAGACHQCRFRKRTISYCSDFI